MGNANADPQVRITNFQQDPANSATTPPLGSFSAAGVFIGSSALKTHAIVVPNGGGNVGFGTVTPNTSYRLEVFGDANFNGTVFTPTGTVSVSDASFKTNENPITNARSLVNQLLPKTFYFDTTNSYGINFPSELQYGFIAQDIENVIPELVSTQNKTADYDTNGVMLSPATSF